MYIFANYLEIFGWSMPVTILIVSMVLIVLGIVMIEEWCWPELLCSAIISIGVIGLILAIAFLFTVAINNDNAKIRNEDLVRFNCENIYTEEDVPIDSTLTCSDKIFRDGDYYLVFTAETSNGFKVDNEIEVKISEDLSDINYEDIKFILSEVPFDNDKDLVEAEADDNGL